MRKLLIVFYLFSVGVFGYSQAPAGYYDSVQGLAGENARTALYNIIKGHTSVNYNNLWGYFNNTDITGGIVTDIYSSYTYSFNVDQCGQYSAEGDCYNREHTVPQNWFNGQSPMYSDLFHIYPTDGFVNGQRGSLPYGEVSTATYTSSNGCKKGNNTYPGYSGTVFDPIDTYKGDIARGYFYMATRYMNVLAGWSGESFQGNTIKQWTLDMMIAWHNNDPVSQKEINRNNAIYGIQGNRNPYIDDASLVDRVFVWATGIKPVDVLKTSMWYSNNVIYIKGVKKEKGELYIYNSLGKLMDVTPVNQANSAYHIELTSGIYFATYQNTQLKLVVL